MVDLDHIPIDLDHGSIAICWRLQTHLASPMTVHQPDALKSSAIRHRIEFDFRFKRASMKLGYPQLLKERGDSYALNSFA
jgi:hypothetical protein